MNKYYQKLEIDKIIDLVNNEIFLEDSIKNFSNSPFLDDIAIIEEKLSEVDEAVVLLERYDKFSIYFQKDISIATILLKTSKHGIVTPLELLNISLFLDTIKDLKLYLNRLDEFEIQYNYINKYVDNAFYPKELNLTIKKIISPYGDILDDASANLKHLRKQITDTEKSIQQKLQEIVQKNSTKLTQAIVSIRNDRYVIPVKNDYKNQVKGIIHDQSASGETVFIEPTIICELNNKLTLLRELEKEEVHLILKNISQSISTYYFELLNSYNNIIDLDITFGKAKYARLINAKKPTINNDGKTNLLNAFHPLLNVAHIVKNDIKIGYDYKGIIITGPNTGGKTVILKTLGLLSLMVKLGLLLPCDEGSNIAIYDNVLADIGDEQSINQNLSTFSSHLKNVINIINIVTDKSLVLLDELGSGTDPLEGSSLSIAIFNHLLQKNCSIVVSSHYSELKIYAYNNPDVINASVEFDIVNLKPTYKLLIGIPGMSNALNIASRLGLPEKLITDANSYLNSKKDIVNETLENLNEKYFELNTQSKEIAFLKTSLEEKISLYNQEIATINQEKSKIINSANLEKEKLIKEAKLEINKLVNELKELKNTPVKPHQVSDIIHEFTKLDETILEDQSEENQIANIKENMLVFVKGYNSYGRVVKILNNNNVEVLIGIATLKVSKSDLSLKEEPLNTPKQISKKNQSTNISITKNASSRLDLRGLHYEEAKDKIDKFIDDAIYSHLQTITFIHGFGTGVIRKLVHETLKTNKYIASYRYGGDGEGGQGATIATLKE